MKTFFAISLSLSAFLFLGACEKHSWEKTKGLHHGAGHGEGHSEKSSGKQAHDKDKKKAH